MVDNIAINGYKGFQTDVQTPNCDTFIQKELCNCSTNINNEQYKCFLAQKQPSNNGYFNHKENYFPDSFEGVGSIVLNRSVLELPLKDGLEGNSTVKARWDKEYSSLAKRWRLDDNRVAIALNCRKHGGYLYECDHKHKNHVPISCRDIHFCPYCGRRYTRQEGNIVYGLFGQIANSISGVAMLHIVATLPKDKWDIVDKNELPQVWYKAIRKYRGDNRKVAGTVAIHHWGDSESIHKQAHLDILMLNVIANDITTKITDLEGNCKDVVNGAVFELFNPYLDVDRLRQCWTDSLNETFGWNIEIADIYTQYYDWATTDKAVLMHRCKYHVRMAISDIYKAWAENKYIVDDDVKEILELPKNFRRCRWFGWLSDCIKSKYLGFLKIAVCKEEQREEYLNEAMYVCGVCGGSLRYCGSVVSDWEIREYGIVRAKEVCNDGG
jgi:hypothetical protein